MSGKNNEKIIQEMQQKKDAFWDFEQEYFAGPARDQNQEDKQLRDYVTQPCWQSMKLTRNRLASKGITVRTQTAVPQSHWKGLAQSAAQNGAGTAAQVPEDPFDGTIRIKQDGRMTGGESRQRLKVIRTYYRDGKKLARKKNLEYVSASFLKNAVDQDTALCPNCGAVGKISSYIDGCDYCGAKFKVSDFEAKVSDFSFEENMPDTGMRAAKQTAIGLAILSLCAAILGVVGGAVVVSLLRRGVDTGMGVIFGILGVLYAFDMAPLFFKTMLWALGAAMVLAVVVDYLLRDQIKGEAIPKKLMRDFSATDFYQNMELMMKDFHLSDKADSVEAYSDRPVDAILAQNRDLIDCDLTRLTFTGAEKTAEGYQIDCLLNLRTVRAKEHSVRTCYETARVRVHGKKGVVDQKLPAIFEYKCGSCGGSIDLLNGCKCQFCGEKFDYSDYGWKVESYETKPRFLPYGWIRLALIAFYILVLGIHIFALSRETENDNWVSLSAEVAKEYAIIDETYDAFPLPDELFDRAVERSEEMGSYERTYIYDCTSLSTDEQLSYLLAAEDAGFTTCSWHDDVMVFYQLVSDGEDEAYLGVKLTFSDTALTVEMYPTETLEELEQ